MTDDRDDVLARCAGMPVRRFDAGDVLVEQAAAPGDAFVLVHGRVAVRSDGSRVVTVAEPGTFLGEMSVLLGQPTTATVVAVEPTVVHVLEDAATVLVDRPDLLLDVARLLARRVAAMTSYLVDLRREYGDAGGHLALMDVVLSAMLAADPGSSDGDRGRDAHGGTPDD